MNYSADYAVRFGDIDTAGVVYYPVFFHYFHQTFEDWFADSLSIPYSELVRGRNLGFPTVRSETQFSKPLRYGDRFRVELTLGAIGQRSITLRYRVARIPGGEEAARAEIKKAVVANDRFESVDLPGDLREVFEAFCSRRADREAGGRLV